jgi:hypothetical protein
MNAPPTPISTGARVCPREGHPREARPRRKRPGPPRGRSGQPGTRGTLRHSVAAAVVVLLVAGCADTPEELTAPVASEDQATQAAPPVDTQAPFQGWTQTFNHGLAGWVTKEDPGLTGWCGTMSQVDRRESSNGMAPSPSVGRAYAVVRHDECNDTYSGIFRDGSGPAAADADVVPHNDHFPTAGFVSELDVYLDPDWPEGTAFGYANSFQVLDEGWPNFRYFMHDVVRSGSQLTVAGTPVHEAGWYTFSHRFTSADGQLHVEFELTKGGQVLHSESIESTLLTLEAISSFPVSNVSNAYVWFVYLTPDLELPVDNQRIRISG